MNNLHNRKDLPLVSIVMAVYHPREDWLTEQLTSLNRQTYPNLALFICDDGPDQPVNPALFQKYITAFRWHLVRNQQNQGSNKTFERLTAMANGEYIAYCDQDDIWEDNKIELLVQKIKETDAELCCSDLSIIDENGRFIADSLTKVRKRHMFLEGADLAPKLAVRNFVTGCAMVIKADTAKAAIPFEEYMVHDHWLALYSALQGEIVFEPTATVRYRQHRENQTSVLAGVSTKEDYYRVKIEGLYKRLCSLRQRFAAAQELSDILDKTILWAQVRKEHYERPRINTAKFLWENRNFDKNTTLFEILLPLMPRFLFDKIVSLLK